MKKRTVFSRLLSLALALLTVGSCFIALPLTADAVEDLNEAVTHVELDGPTWSISPGALPDGVGLENATLTNGLALAKSDASLTATTDPENPLLPAWSVENDCSDVVLHDVSANITDYKEFIYTVELFFDSFPTDTISLFHWAIAEDNEDAPTRGISINQNGHLLASNATDTGISLPTGKWCTLSLTYSPTGGFFTVTLDGFTVHRDTFTAVSEATGSRLHLLEGNSQYTVYIKNITLATTNRTHWSVDTQKTVTLKSHVAADYGEHSLSASTDNFKSYSNPINENQTVWGFNEARTAANSRGAFFIHDDENLLADAAAFVVSTDLYFTAFPSGTYSTSDNRSANDYPVSLITWRVKRTATSSYQFYSIRINENGELCYAADSTSGTGVFLETGTWYHIDMVFCPDTGRYQIFLNGEPAYIGAFSRVVSTYSSDVRFFDGYFRYTAYLRFPEVYTLDDPNVGVIDESSADYFGYQAKDNGDGTFDVRFLSAVDPSSFSGSDTSNLFATAGYEVTAVWKDANDEIQSRVQRFTADAVFKSVSAENGTFTLPDGDYIHAFILRGIDASLERIEFAIRPYTDLQDGTRRYGSAATLFWNGEYDETGDPLLSRIQQTSLYKTTATDDTFVGRRTAVGSPAVDETQPNGASKYLKLRYSSSTSYNREVYVKFALSDVAAERILDACRIQVRLYAYTVPSSSTWSADEVAAGGIKMRISGSSADWSEDTLCYADRANNPIPTAGEALADGILVDDQWILLDVTDYAKEIAKTVDGSGYISFKIELTDKGGSGDKTVLLNSSESTNAPELLVYPALFAHEVDLPKYNNKGYEPWGYAETIVDRWISEGYKDVYTAGDVQWHVDFDEMSSVTDNGGSNQYTLSASSTRFALAASPTDPDEKVLSLSNHAGYLTLTDTDLALTAEDSFSVEADFLFTQFPYGGKYTSDPTTAKESPMSLICWMPSSGSYNYGVRIDSDGYLYTVRDGAYQNSGKYLTVDEWHNVRIDYDRAGETFTVYLDDQVVASEDLPQTATQSKIMLLDGAFKYTVNTKDIRVYGHDAYEVLDLQKVDNTTENGAYNTAIQWRTSHVSNKINSEIYVRSIASLAEVEGYDAASVTPPQYGKYGGITNAGFEGTATGYFHTEIISGRTFIIDPEGYPYFAVGMNTVELGATDNQVAATLNEYKTAENFYSSISSELRDLGINTVWGGDWKKLLAAGTEEKQLGTVVGIGAVSGYMSSLKLSNNNSSVKFKHNNTMNVFDPDFIAYVEKKVMDTTAGYTDDPRILGWTSDNEISAQDNMLYDYLTIDATAPENAFSYAVAWTFLRERTGKANPSHEDITASLSEEFKALVYDHYFRVVTTAFDKAGVKQMYLGNRIHSDNRNSEGYLRAASQYVDILTVNLYGGPEPPTNTIEYMYQYSGKPIVVTEFYAKAQDTTDMNGIRLMNQTNAGWVVKTQEDRAAHYENYVMRLLESRCCVGWTWYRFRDNDQRVYGDTDGNVYVDHNMSGGAISSYIKVGTYVKKTAEDGTASYSITVDSAFLAVLDTMDMTVAGDPYANFVSTTITPSNAGEKLFTIHEGEYGGDNSNNGSNKGLYDNKMNIYEPLANAYRRVDQHIMGLVNYFDALHAAD